MCLNGDWSTRRPGHLVAKIGWSTRRQNNKVSKNLYFQKIAYTYLKPSFMC